MDNNTDKKKKDFSLLSYDFKIVSPTANLCEIHELCSKIGKEWYFQHERAQDGNSHYIGRIKLLKQERIYKVVELFASVGANISVTDKYYTRSKLYNIGEKNTVLLSGPWSNKRKPSPPSNATIRTLIDTQSKTEIYDHEKTPPIHIAIDNTKEKTIISMSRHLNWKDHIREDITSNVSNKFINLVLDVGANHIDDIISLMSHFSKNPSFKTMHYAEYAEDVLEGITNTAMCDAYLIQLISPFEVQSVGVVMSTLMDLKSGHIKARNSNNIHLVYPPHIWLFVPITPDPTHHPLPLWKIWEIISTDDGECLEELH